MIRPIGSLRVGVGDDVPTIGLAAWRPAPGARPITLALATSSPERQDTLAAVFGSRARRDVTTRGRRLRLVPDAAIVDSPALLEHRAVADLLAPASVVLAADVGVEAAVDLVRAGADALLPTGADADDVREAVLCVLRGEAVVPPAVAVAIAQRVRAAEHRG